MVIFLIFRKMLRELVPRLELGKIWVAARRLDHFGITSIVYFYLFYLSYISFIYSIRE